MTLTAKPPNIFNELFVRHGGTVVTGSLSQDGTVTAEPRNKNKLPVVEDNEYRKDQRKALRTQQRIRDKRSTPKPRRAK